MRTHSVVVLNQRRWQSLGGQHGKGVDGLFQKVSFQTAFEGVESQILSLKVWYQEVVHSRL